MLSGRTTNIDAVIEELYREYGFENIDKGEVAEWIFKAMSLIGTPYPFPDKPGELDIIEYKAVLPVDLYSILGVREKTTGLNFRENTNLFQSFGLPAYVLGSEVETADVDPLTDINYDTYIGSEYASEYFTFKTQGNYIFTGMQNGTIEIAYKAIPIDIITGMPLIPDDVRYIRGVVSFIAERIAFRMYLKDMLTERKYDLIRTDYLFNIGSAKNTCHALSPARMETLINRWKSTYLGPEHFDDGLAFLGSRE
jgi:hypothetical protein